MAEPLDILADELYDLRCELARDEAGEVSHPAERLNAMRSPPVSGCTSCSARRTSSRSGLARARGRPT
jgi:hypothetical protein